METKVIGYLVIEDIDGCALRVLLMPEEEAVDYMLRNFTDVSINWCDSDGKFWGDHIDSHTLISYDSRYKLQEIMSDGSLGKVKDTICGGFVFPYLVGETSHSYTPANLE